MKHFARLLIILALLATVSAGARSAANLDQLALQQTAGANAYIEPPTGQIIIKYYDTANLAGLNAADQPARMNALRAAAGIDLTYFRAMSGDAHVLRLPEALPVAEVQQIAQRLSALPDVEYAEPDRILQLALTPNDPSYSNQWHYTTPYGVNAPAAWDITTGSVNVVVAVIDTGYTDHTDLSGRFVGGYDFISSGQAPIDPNDGNGRDSDAHDPGDWITANQCYAGSPARNSSWHGTHVAGTIGANSNNGVGVAGINWASRILPVRVLGRCGGSTSDIADAIRWAAGLSEAGVPNNAYPAQVINMSLGGSGPCGATTQTAINDAVAAGTTVVVAAGNSNADADGFTPANCNNVVTVAATNRTGNRAYYSNYDADSTPVVELSGPGGETFVATDGVLSTLNTGATVPAGDTYQYYQGTSMATPHVAGVASLVYSLSPSLTPAQVSRILTSTVTAFPGGSTCSTTTCGTGIVNAYNAVNALPRISNLSPGSAVSQTTPISLTVNGANFVNNAKVKWNATNLATVFISSTQIKANVPAGLLSTTGVVSITVNETHATYGSLTTASLPFTVFGGASQFIYLPSVLKNVGEPPPPPPPPGPTPGFWESNTGDEFYVTTDSAYVDNFAIYVSVPGCGNYKITHLTPVAITSDQFSFSGSFYASGTFTSDTVASGTDGLSSFNIPGCGLVTGGPWSWTATWKNSSQPAIVPASIVGPDGIERITTISIQRGIHNTDPAKQP